MNQTQKFYCRYCNKPYPTIESAMFCQCTNPRPRWNAKVGSGLSEMDKYAQEQKIIHREQIKLLKLVAMDKNSPKINLNTPPIKENEK